jgi:hypothetical protein
LVFEESLEPNNFNNTTGCPTGWPFSFEGGNEVLNHNEQHYTPQALAELWGLSATKVRRLFENENNVLRIGEPSRRAGRTLTRSYYTMRIPASTAERVYKRLTRAA